MGIGKTTGGPFKLLVKVVRCTTSSIEGQTEDKSQSCPNSKLTSGFKFNASMTLKGHQKNDMYYRYFS